MASSARLTGLLIAAAVATVVLTDIAIVVASGGRDPDAAERMHRVWPIALSSAMVVILVMSFLYSALTTSIRELEDRERRANYLAVHDPLTGLPNRLLLSDHLEMALARMRTQSEKLALLTLDLDGFKQVNDSLGHAAGDELLRRVAKRLQEATRQTDTVARIGGDEFVVLLSGPRDRDEVEALGTRLLASLREPISLDGHAVQVSASIGAILAPDDTAGISELLRKSDMALYRAKARGRDQIEFFADAPAGGRQAA